MQKYLYCRALARNCDAPIDDKKGGSAKSWKNGNPVRVVGSYMYVDKFRLVMCVTYTLEYTYVHVGA